MNLILKIYIFRFISTLLLVLVLPIGLSASEQIWFLEKMKAESEKIKKVSCDMEYSIKSSAGSLLKQQGILVADIPNNTVVIEYQKPSAIGMMFKNSSLFLRDKNTGKYVAVNNPSDQPGVFLMNDFYQYNYLKNYIYKEKVRETAKNGHIVIVYDGYDTSTGSETLAVTLWADSETGFIHKMEIPGSGIMGAVKAEIAYSYISGSWVPCRILCNVIMGASGGSSLFVLKNVKIENK